VLACEASCTSSGYFNGTWRSAVRGAWLGLQARRGLSIRRLEQSRSAVGEGAHEVCRGHDAVDWQELMWVKPGAPYNTGITGPGEWEMIDPDR
jgi:hypothetical protein